MKNQYFYDGTRQYFQQHRYPKSFKRKKGKKGFINDMPVYSGKQQHENGVIYEGEWLDGFRHGKA